MDSNTSSRVGSGDHDRCCYLRVSILPTRKTIKGFERVRRYSESGSSLQRTEDEYGEEPETVLGLKPIMFHLPQGGTGGRRWQKVVAVHLHTRDPRRCSALRYLAFSSRFCFCHMRSKGTPSSSPSSTKRTTCFTGATFELSW